MARTELTMVTLIDLFHKMEDGGISAPAYTRAFVWNKSRIVDLLESIYQGYPIGTILVVEGIPDQFETADVNLSRFPRLKETQYDRYSTLWVIDGLQRLIALYGSLKGDYTDMEVYFDLRQDRFLQKTRAVSDDSVVKMSSLFDYVKFMGLQEKFFQSEHSADLVGSLNQLHRAFIEYQIPLQVVRDVDMNEAVNVFARLNKSGLALSRQEIERAKNQPDPKKPS
ncbi:DUF262 domain-containing protein [Rugamonas rivuli]|uniref:DUF262 domain-containing protein n=1 Tax=Rugamonas rivuli TaxID=2743358 RepID=A0A843SFL8_9BURK|nr:DUF262 domain-containing protein [Rugamonas rivuli]MQA23405.1 DUF262 domain-containing protein [Rugamonas rivuli]